MKRKTYNAVSNALTHAPASPSIGAERSGVSVIALPVLAPASSTTAASATRGARAVDFTSEKVVFDFAHLGAGIVRVWGIGA